MIRFGLSAALLAASLCAQSENQQANVLDNQGDTAGARKIFQRLIDGAADPAAKANAQRSMAMSYAFDGDCRNTIKYEQMAIAYWQAQNAFVEAGEIANEGARACLDAGDLETAEQWYRKGTELGLKEPDPNKNPAELWNFRLEHALGRLAARRGDKAEAARHVEAARRILEGSSALRNGQQRFYPYLVGYVALYTGDFATAETELAKAVEMGPNDAFLKCLLGMTYERLGRKDAAAEWYKKAAAATPPDAHNAAAAFVRTFTRKKLM
jgi:tetratricopeptide (TPR) repeat protein